MGGCSLPRLPHWTVFAHLEIHLPGISSDDSSTLQKLVADYAAKLSTGDYAGAYTILGSEAKVSFKNDILGGSEETAANQAGECVFDVTIVDGCLRLSF